MGREELIDVYLDTHKTAKNKYPAGRSNSKKYKVGEVFVDPSSRINYIHVINEDTVSALIGVEEFTIDRICVLNMASAKKPGGGVKNGAKSQEEDLFRCSNLSILVEDSLYPLTDGECVYTEDVTFFKNSNYETIDPIVCDVVTIPAINLNSRNKQIETHHYIKSTKDRIRLMLSLAIERDCKIMILGAWGCGVFKNSPILMSSFFKEVIVQEGYGLYFHKIIFPVINDVNSAGNNYQVFKQTLENNISTTN